MTFVESLSPKASTWFILAITTLVQAPVIQSLMDSAIQLINHYPVDKCLRNQSRYSLDRELFGGLRYPLSNLQTQLFPVWGPV